MNELNVCTLELSRKLAEAGIVLETEAVWRYDRLTDSWDLFWYENTLEDDLRIPAPNSAELWRELPDLIGIGELRLVRIINTHETVVYYGWIDDEGIEHTESKVYRSTNPADALAELLIYVKGRAKG